jgi:hypothetical protein
MGKPGMDRPRDHHAGDAGHWRILTGGFGKAWTSHG